MQVPVCALIAWLAVILIALVPKRLSILDFAFLYCVVLTVTATSNTFFELNWHSVTVPRNPVSYTAAAISRLISIPLLIMIAVNFLQASKGRKPQWIISAVIWIGLSIFDWVLSRVNVLTYHYPFAWHAIGTPTTYLALIIFSWGLTWWYKRLNRKVVRHV